MGQVGQLVLGAVGAVIGGIYGGPTGALLGWSIGSGVGMLLFPPKQKTQEGPRLSDLQGIQNSSYGVPIPYYWGNMRVPGNVIWTHGLEEDRTEENPGGKGAAKGLKLITYKYYASWATGFGATELFMRKDGTGIEQMFGGNTVRRIWFDSKLVFDCSANQVSANSENLTGVFSQAEGSINSVGVGDNLQIPGLQWRVHPGTDLLGPNVDDLTETPDPVIVQWEGANAPLHKGVQHIVFDRVPLEGVGNRIPTVSAEFMTQAFGDSDEPPVSNLNDTLQWIDHPFEPYNYIMPTVDPTRNVGYSVTYKTETDNSVNPPVTSYWAGFSTFNATTMQELTAQNYAELRGGLVVGAGGSVSGALPVNAYVAPADALYVLEIDQKARTGAVSAYDGDTLEWLGAIELAPVATGAMIYGTVLPTPLDFARAILLVADPLGTRIDRCLIVDGHYAQGGVLSTSGVGILWDSGLGTMPDGSKVIERFLIPGQTWQNHVDAWFIERRMDASFQPIPKIFVSRIEVRFSPTGTMGAGITGTWAIDTLPLFQGYRIVWTDPTIPDFTGNYNISRVWHDPSDDTLVFGFAQPYETFIKWDWKTGEGLWDSVMVAEAARPGLGGQETARSLGTTGMPFSGFGDLTGKYLRGTPALLDLSTGKVGFDPSIIPYAYSATRTGVLYGVAASVFVPDPDDPDGVVLREGSTINRHLGFITYSKPTTLRKVMDDTFRAAALFGNLDPSFSLDTPFVPAGPARLTDAAAKIPIRGYLAARPWTIQEVLQPLLDAYDVDATAADGQLTFDLRGRAVTAEIPYEDLVLRRDGGAIEQRTSYSGDVARKVLVHHVNPQHNYDTSVQDFEIPLRDTPIIGNAGETTVDLPLSLRPEEAKAIALRLLQRIWNERTTFQFTLPPKYLGLVENDPVVLTFRDGSTVRVRLTEVSVGADWTIEATAVTEAAIQFASD